MSKKTLPKTYERSQFLFTYELSQLSKNPVFLTTVIEGKFEGKRGEGDRLAPCHQSLSNRYPKKRAKVNVSVF